MDLGCGLNSNKVSGILSRQTRVGLYSAFSSSRKARVLMVLIMVFISKIGDNWQLTKSNRQFDLSIMKCEHFENAKNKLVAGSWKPILIADS